MTTPDPVEEHLTSRDGTRIGYLRQGCGPGLILVQGAMGTAHNFRDLARALSNNFTVYRPDRRGRGMSPKPYTPEHQIARDVEDLEALLQETGATRVFGLSSGAVITLEAARRLPRITHLAVYEPPFYQDGISRQGILRLNTEIERGALPSALISSLRTAETAPAPLRLLPRTAARLLAAAVLATDARTSTDAPKLRDLLPGIRYDFHVVASRDTQLEVYATLHQRLLLVSGTKSPAFLRAGVRRLHSQVPQSEHVEFTGPDHSGPWNVEQGGHPNLVAQTLRTFFTEDDRCQPDQP